MCKMGPRRQFLRNMGLGTAALLAAGRAPAARGYAANSAVALACIGTGGRCRRLMKQLAAVPGAKIVAVCDIWDEHLKLGRELADPQATASKEYRELLERKDVDAVLIGTPDHWHAKMTVDACAAGKDVYVEKPVTHALAEGPAVIEAQNKHRRIVQVGTQQRSMPHLQEACEIVRSGKLGKIHKVHLSWNRNRPEHLRDLKIDPATVDWQRFLGSARPQPFDQYRFRMWRWFWDFGGGIFTDLMVHWIDVAHWFLGLDHPQTAASIGDHFMAKGVWETPDTVQTLLKYPGRDVQVYFEGTFVNARNAAMIELLGSEGTLYVDRGRYEIYPERKSRLQASEKILGEGPRGGDYYLNPNSELLHLRNWIECIARRQPPNAPAESGVGAAAAAHLANMALRSGQVAHWKEERG